MSRKSACPKCGRLIAQSQQERHAKHSVCAATVNTKRLERMGYTRCKAYARSIECAKIPIERKPTIYTSTRAAARGNMQLYVVKWPWAPTWAVLVAESCTRLAHPVYRCNQLRKKLLLTAELEWRQALEAIYKLGGDNTAIDQMVHPAAEALIKK